MGLLQLAFGDVAQFLKCATASSSKLSGVSQSTLRFRTVISLVLREKGNFPSRNIASNYNTTGDIFHEGNEN